MKKLLLSLLTLSFLLGSMDFSKTSENILIAYFLLLELKETNNLDNDKACAGFLSLSTDNNVIGMIYSNQAKHSDYKVLKENDYILDIRTV